MKKRRAAMQVFLLLTLHPHPQRKKSYGFPRAHVALHNEPTTFEEAIDSPEKAEWKEAMANEIKSLTMSGSWLIYLLERKLLAVKGENECRQVN